MTFGLVFSFLVLFFLAGIRRAVRPHKGLWDRRCPHCTTRIPMRASVCSACGRDMPKSMTLWERMFVH